MDAFRSKEIDAIVKEIHKLFSTSNGIDLEALSQNKKIWFIKGMQYFVPISLKLGDIYIIATSPYTEFRGIDYDAHEFGHILLGHLDKNSKTYNLSGEKKEVEANYFSVALMGEVYKKVSFWKRWYAEARYPDASNRSSFGNENIWKSYVIFDIQKRAKKEMKKRGVNLPKTK